MENYENISEEEELTPEQRRIQLLEEWKNLKNVGNQRLESGLSKMKKADAQNITPEQLKEVQDVQGLGNVHQASLDFLQAGSGTDMTNQRKTAQNIYNQPKTNLFEKQSLSDEMRKQGMEDVKISQAEVQGATAKNKLGSELYNESQQVREFSPEEQETLRELFGDNIPANMSELPVRADLQKMIQGKQQQEFTQNKQNEELNLIREKLNLQGKQLIPMKDEEGNEIQGVYDYKTGEIKPIKGTIIPKRGNTQINIGKEYKNFNDNITKQFNAREAHTAIQEYNTSLEGLNPGETKEADNLARKQLGLIVAKFDQGSKSNPVTSLNQLGASILKYINTSDFQTKNPKVGEAAMKRLNSAIKMAALNKASGRDSVFQTQFNLANAFGGTVSGREVPQEKITGLQHSLGRRIGGALRQSISFSQDKEAMGEAAREIFGDYTNEYLNEYGKLNKKQKQEVEDSLRRGEKIEGSNNIPGYNKIEENENEWLPEIKKMEGQVRPFDKYQDYKRKASLLNEFKSRKGSA